MANAVLFDMGGVWIKNPAEGMMHYCAEQLGVTLDAYVEAHSKYDNDFQRGKLTEPAYLKNVCGELAVHEPKQLLWTEAIKRNFAPDHEVLASARVLRDARYRTGILSNTETPWVDVLVTSGYCLVFDTATFSCHEGYRKPEPEMYEIAARKADAPMEDIVFVDNEEKFVKGAKDAGMDAILFKDAQQLREEFRSRGLPV